jgi:hypothetical protein
MEADLVRIGNHYYALTLNLILTAFFGLLGSIAYFRYQRKIKREDEKNQKLEDSKDQADTEKKDALAKLVEERHGTLIGKFDETKKEIIKKIDDHVCAQEKWQDSADERFFSHGHRVIGDITEDIILKKK